MKKVLFISYYFPPMGGGGVQRSLKFVKYLPSFGYIPVVLTSPIDYNKIYPHDDNMLDEVPKEIQIYRCNFGITTKSMAKFRKITDFSNSGEKLWLKNAIEIGNKIFKDNKIDLIFATMSPFSTAFIAQKLSERNNIPWVADLRDPWALDEMYSYPSVIHRYLEKKCMKTTLNTAQFIIMNTNESMKILKKSFRWNSKTNITYITNGYDAEDFFEERSNENSAFFKIVHTGSLHTKFGLELRKKRLYYTLFGKMNLHIDVLPRSHYYLIKALELIKINTPDMYKYIQLIFAGCLSDIDKELIYNSKISKSTFFLNYISHKQTIDLIKNADLLFLPMHKLPQNKKATVTPGKTYEYLASGRPILGAVPDGDTKEILIKSNIAKICEPDNYIEMSKIILSELIKWNNKKNIYEPRREFIQQFERKELTKKLANIFNRIV